MERYLKNIKQGIQYGEYDDILVEPFMSKELLYASIKGRIKSKVKSSGTPTLTDIELKNIIDDVKETAHITFVIFCKLEILERTETGYQLTEKGKKLIKLQNMISLQNELKNYGRN